MKKVLIFLAIIVVLSCASTKETKQQENSTQSFVWNGANLYFLLTDRFNNGNLENDINFDRTKKTATLRGFKGGDLQGVTQKIKEGYFDRLGINAIWMTPVVEQIHGGTNEGTGVTYGFHGYWTKDWTKIDPNYGTKEDLQELVTTAHAHGIRVLLDAVINHTGPVTEKDPVWPTSWVRTEPQCTYDKYETTISCTLVKNLPDIKTESNENVELPEHLITKWKKEGRYKQEVKELDEFFTKTGYPRAPRFYIMKWLADYITEFGIDGYRVDTVKHVEENVWQEFKEVCDASFSQWKKEHPDKVLDENDFYLVGEVYNYSISNGKNFDFGDKKVDYFDKAFNSLINFEFKWNAKQLPTYEVLFARYHKQLNNELNGYGIMNYVSSHDDGLPFDKERKRVFEAGTKLLLTPGTSQLYYGDEIARELIVDGAEGDANLRSMMNWESIQNKETKDVLKHFQKLGKFRKNHPSVGAGTHKMISESPYVFQRSFLKNDLKDEVVVGLELPKGKKEITVGTVFNNGIEVRDAYSNQIVKVIDGKVTLTSPFTIVLLEKN